MTHSFSVGASLAFGWDAFKKRPWFFIGITLIIMVVGWIGSAIAEQSQGSAAMPLGLIINILLNILVGMGTIALYLKAHDDTSSAEVHHLWHPHPFWKYLGAAILYMLIVGIPSLPFIFGSIAMGAGGILVGESQLLLVALGLLVTGVIIAIAITTVFLFAMFLVIDRSLGPVEAFKESARITRGARLSLFLFLLALGLINLLGLVCLIVGLLVSIPVTSLAMAHAYRSLEHEANEVVPASDVTPVSA